MSGKISRREFMKRAGSGIIALGLGFTPDQKGIEKRPLGKTGLNVTILGLGCAQIGRWRYSLSEGARIVEACIDAGINYIDCASTYGDAEIKVGEVMKVRRKGIILATKTLERDKEKSWREINKSLERLKTDYIDLLQIHAVNDMMTLNIITGKNGSLLSVIRAKEEGLCKHIGITGHTRPDVIKEALRRFPFETVLAPLSSTDKLINDFGDVLFPIAKTMGFGIIAMKVLTAGKVTQYVEESLRYVLSLPVSTAIVGMETIDEVKQNVWIAKNFTPMTPDEMSSLVNKTKKYANTSIMWWKRE